MLAIMIWYFLSFKNEASPENRFEYSYNCFVQYFQENFHNTRQSISIASILEAPLNSANIARTAVPQPISKTVFLGKIMFSNMCCSIIKVVSWCPYQKTFWVQLQSHNQHSLVDEKGLERHIS